MRHQHFFTLCFLNQTDLSLRTQNKLLNDAESFKAMDKTAIVCLFERLFQMVS